MDKSIHGKRVDTKLFLVINLQLPQKQLLADHLSSLNTVKIWR